MKVAEWWTRVEYPVHMYTAPPDVDPVISLDMCPGPLVCPK